MASEAWIECGRKTYHYPTSESLYFTRCSERLALYSGVPAKSTGLIASHRLDKVTAYGFVKPVVKRNT